LSCFHRFLCSVDDENQEGHGKPAKPTFSFMIEGLDGDDRYRMVEDEFLSTAQQFTAHLHAAEYERLKATSEMENAQMIKNISRPVIGQMTDLVRIKRERKALEEKQRLAARKLRKLQGANPSGGGDGDDESTEHDEAHDSWQKQSLYGLMESPRTKRYAARLDGLPTATSVTRAAAGYDSKVAKKTVSPRRPNLKELESPSTSTDRHAHKIKNDSASSHRLVHRSSQSAPDTPSSRIAAATKAYKSSPSGVSSYKSQPEFPQHDQPKMAGNNMATPDNGGEGEEEELDFIARMNKRQEERRRSREQRRSTIGGGSSSRNRSNSADILPDFL